MILRCNFDHPESPEWNRLSGYIRDWEPRFDLWYSPQTPRIYEPDGTLYAVCLSETRLTTDRRSVEVMTGDLIVVPLGVAIDVETEIDLLCIKYDGPQPYHFRERFIQVWGFEHIRADEAVTPERTAFHRLQYTVHPPDSPPTGDPGASLDLKLLVLLESDKTRGDEKHARSCVLADQVQATELQGADRVGILTLTSEILHELRLQKLNEASAMTPEFPFPR